MPALDIRIVRRGDHPPLEELTGGKKLIHLGEGTSMAAVLLEGGMASGAPSVALGIDLEATDSYIVAETSLALFISLMAAARGAFPEAFRGGPFQEGAPSVSKLVQVVEARDLLATVDAADAWAYITPAIRTQISRALDLLNEALTP